MNVGTVELTEPAATGTGPRRTAHLLDRALSTPERVVALCGKVIRGVPARRPHDSCVVCRSIFENKARWNR